jgi:membrane associated rhomboid family serine protease
MTPLWAAPPVLGLIGWILVASLLGIPKTADPLSGETYGVLAAVSATALFNVLTGRFDPPANIPRTGKAEPIRRLSQFVVAVVLACSIITAVFGVASAEDRWIVYVPSVAGVGAVGGILLGMLFARV